MTRWSWLNKFAMMDHVQVPQDVQFHSRSRVAGDWLSGLTHMIFDEDARQFFRNKLGKPCIYGGHGTLQIYRGKSPRLWKDAHPGGCPRHHSVFNPEYCFDCYKVSVLPRM